MVDDRFRKFVVEHRDAINGMISQLWPLVDEHVNEQLRHGFERCAAPCLLALSARAGKVTLPREWLDARFLALLRLLLTAIKKRYYAFPDKFIVAVDQELLFECILPRIITGGLVDGSMDLPLLLFNAGENLREVSRAFYDEIVHAVDIMARRPDHARAIIHVAAWLAGDVKRRTHALSIITGGLIPPEILPALVFKGSIPPNNVIGTQIARQLNGLIAAAFADDPWLSPQAMRDDPVFSKLAGIAVGPLQAIPPAIERELGARAAAKKMARPAALKFLGKVGRYEGFGGSFDTPPVVVGTPAEATAIARTGAGSLFHVYYGGTGMRVHTIGTTTCEELVYACDLGLVARYQDGTVVALQSGDNLGILAHPTGRYIATGGQSVAFFLDQDANIVHRIGLNGPISSQDVAFDDTITGAAAFDGDRLAIVCRDHHRKAWALHEVDVGGKPRKICDLPGESMVAACGRIITCLQPDGKTRIVDVHDWTESFVPTSIDPASVTSIHVTPREIVTTHAFTYAIHFHGPPV